jgi:hypothetical protein
MSLSRLVEGSEIHFGGNLGSLVFIMGIKGNLQFHVSGILVNSGDSIGGDGCDKDHLMSISGGL